MSLENTPDITGDHLSWSAVLQRVAIGVGGAAMFGAGSLVVSTSTEVKVHEARLQQLETKLEKIPEIDRNLTVLNGKVDVLNQKLDDAKQVASERIRR